MVDTAAFNIHRITKIWDIMLEHLNLLIEHKVLSYPHLIAIKQLPSSATLPFPSIHYLPYFYSLFPIPYSIS